MTLGIDFTTFSEMHNGGKDQVAFNLLRGWSEAGHAKEIVCFCRGLLSEKLRDISEDFRVVDLLKLPREALEKEHIPDAILKENNVDILFFTNKGTPRVRFNIPTVAVEHDIFSVHYPELFDKCYPREDNNRAEIAADFEYRDRIIAISEYDRSAMLEHFPWKGDDVKMIYDPVVFPFRAEDAGAAQCEKKYITAINIQHRHKNIRTLINAFIAIMDKLPYDLVLIGRIPKFMIPIRKIIQIRGYDKRIKFTNFVSDEELRDYVAKTRLFVNPSLHEGFGMSAVEMMGAMVPTLVADNSSQREVTLGLCDYYSPGEDVNALSAAMLAALERPMDTEKLAEAARLVQEKYNYAKISAEYWDYFESLC